MTVMKWIVLNIQSYTQTFLPHVAVDGNLERLKEDFLDYFCFMGLNLKN